MTTVMKRITKGVVLKGETTDVTENAEGSLFQNSSELRLKAYIEGAVRQVVTNTQSQVLTNKTIDADNNSVSNIQTSNLKSGVLNTSTTLASASNTQVPSALAVKTYVDDKTAAQNEASEIGFTPVGTIAATTVQAMGQELDSDIQGHITDTADAHAASAITNTPSGNLVATTVQAALNELQGDVDTRATSTDLTNHTTASANVHGLAGGSSVVGTTDSQTLTNKIITGADIRTPIRSDVKQDTKANLITYALTASNGQLCFATDTKEMFQVVDTLLESVGGSAGVGGVDILFAQTFEEAALSDFTQTGLSLSTSSPLHGAVSALLTHQAAVNQSFKQVIAVDPKFRGETMVLRLNVKSNAPAGDVTLNIYDETNAANIVASEQLQLSNDVSGVLNTVSYTIPSTCASLSYTITALPEAGSPVTRVDDIISELAVTSLLSTAVEVPVVTGWQGYTPVFQGFGTPSAVEFEWRQVGEDVEIRGKFTSGTPTAVEARIGLPGGLISAGTGLIPSLQPAGVFFRNSNGGASASKGGSVLIEPSVGYVTFTSTNVFRETSVNWVTKSTANSDFTTNDIVGFTARVPCAGLSATTTKTIALTQSGLVQGADSVLRAVGSAGQSVTALVTDIPFSTVQLSSGADIQFNGSSFTALSSGIYLIEGCIDFGGSLTRTVELYVNGISYRRISDVTSANDKQTFSYSDFFVAGSVVSIRVGSNGGTLENSTSNASHYLTVTKESSLKQVSVNPNSKITIPTSELRFEGASTRGSTATAIVRFDSVAKIRGDAFTVVSDAVNGTAITMTKAGRLNIACSLVGNASSTAHYISRNQAVLTSLPSSASEVLSVSTSAVSSASTMTWEGTVAVGDIIRISATNSPTANIGNSLNLSFQEQDIAVSVTNVLPQFSDSDSSVRVQTANGYGSTNTFIRRFSDIRDNIGVDVEYADSATLGASFTAKSNGIYEISYTDVFNVGVSFGITKNASGTTAVASLPTSQILSVPTTAGSGSLSVASWQGYLLAGDVIRPHTQASAANANGVYSTFTMSKVGKPNVTGVDVTPFVNIPQPTVQDIRLTAASGQGSDTSIRFSIAQNSNNGVLAVTDNATNGTRFVALKRCTVNAQVALNIPSGTDTVGYVYVNETAYSFVEIDAGGNTNLASISVDVVLQAGDYISFRSSVVQSGAVGTVVATALSDQILTAPETFSTDTASLTYAPSSLYTLSTLNNAPVGTFITFTYAINSNTRTQTTTAPTQTTADMNTNGIRVFARAYNAASTAGNPAAIAIQIGKGLKGRSLDLYKSVGKATSMEADYSVVSSTISLGFYNKSYNETTGILLLDAAFQQLSANSTCAFAASDGTSPTDGYLVINASKHVSLTGLNIERVSARAVNSAGTSIPNAATILTWDSVKTFDTHGALNAGTGVFTSPETGYYQVSGGISFGNDTYIINHQANLYVYKNGVEYSRAIWRAHAATTIQANVYISDVVFLGKGDTLDLRAQNESGPTALTASATQNFFSIAKVNIGGKS